MFDSRPAGRTPAQWRIARLLMVALGGLTSGACEIRDSSTVSPNASSSATLPAPAVSPLQKPAGASSRTHSAGAASQGIEFVVGYQRGYDLARQTRRPMLLFFTAEWCQYCHQLANESFRDGQVVELSRRFVCVVVDADAEPEVCRRFQVRGYPTVLFVSHLAAPLSRIVGKQPPQDFVARMRAALQSVARSPNRVQRR